MYGFPLLYGDQNNAFINNSSAVITAGFARKLFGVENAIGKTLTIQTTTDGMTQDYTISAILKDMPYNSVTGFLNDHYSVFIPAEGSKYYQFGDPTQGWENANVVSFIEANKNVSTNELITPLKNILKKYTKEDVSQNLNIQTLPVKDYYLNDHNYAVKKMMLILSLVAVFILLMVIVNFININIGASSYRIKEIGLRKTFGSVRRLVMLQFITEAIVLAFISGLFAVLIYQLLLPVFSDILNASLPGFFHFTSKEYVFLLLLVSTVGMLAGAYPGIVLGSTNLLQAVRGKMNNSKQGITLKRVLLVVQFSLAILVFICAMNLSRQVNYIFNKDLGYNKDQVMIITAFPKQWDSTGLLRIEAIKKGIETLPSVSAATLTYNVPEGTPDGRIALNSPMNLSSGSELNLPLSFADEEYAKTFGIQMLGGSFFIDNKDGIVLNQTAVKKLGLTDENAIGTQLRSPVVNTPIPIVGVMKDYNFSGIQEKIGPIGFIHVKNTNIYRYIAVKLRSSNMAVSIDEIKTKWKSFAPNAPFDYSFMDDKFAALYKSDLQLQKASNVATILSLVIVLLGLVGIVSFMLTKRNKEITVRKVLGADALHIVILFFKEYVVLIVIANLIAWPLAYLVTEKLFQNFAYHVHQNMYPYLLVTFLVFALSFILIFLQSFKAAVQNPVKSLRQNDE